MHYQNKKISHKMIAIKLNSLPFDRIQEFLENIDNLTYFPAEILNPKPIENKDYQKNVIINDPIIVRELTFLHNETKTQMISVRDLPKNNKN